MSEGSPVPSPCIKTCVLDEAGRYCIGCYRTLDEIGLWSQLSDPERLGVLAELPGRRQRLDTRGAAKWIEQSCSRCGAKFECGARDTLRPCWCVSYPPVAPSGADARCLCPPCLAAASTK